MIFSESPLKQRIRLLGERLDSHRKRQQEQHPGLTLTGKETLIHDQGLVTLLRQIRDELDEAVLEAYGWQDCSGDHRSPRMDGASEEDSRRPVIAATLLTRLVALNHERAAEQKSGLIRWLRREYQNPSAAAPPPVQSILQGTETSDHSKSNISSPLARPPVRSSRDHPQAHRRLRQECRNS